jgi:cytochrome c-type biogenesis protein CcmF
MHLFAYLLLVVCLLLCLGLSAAAAAQCWQGRTSLLPWLERGNWALTALVTLASGVLLWAFGTHQFSFQYVANYSDRLMPLFYTLTAFWAGQAGSLLFWAWTVTLFGAAFSLSPGYRRMADETRVWYWVFYLAVMGFFMLLLTNWSNPFLKLVPAPQDGNGLNPLLQNPAMIFHPPLLFLGYAGFTIPACLALAQTLSRGRDHASWLEASRNFNLIAWLFLTAGIILGAWWSYMELGWGGYWAWDPVENASLIPWLTATAFLHTAVVESRRGSLQKTNVFLMGLTLLMAFFATYLVRSGVVDSLHAFGSGGVATPLMLLILTGLAVIGMALFAGDIGRGRPLEDLFSRGGLLLVAAWILLILGFVILMGTMWPVFSKFWSPNPVGLDQGFYNRVCLPFFVLLALLLAVCPWVGWKGGLRRPAVVAGIGAVFVAACALVWVLGFRLVLPLVGIGAAVACIAGIGALFATDKGVRKVHASWGAYGVHAGLALVVLGVAFSGPYMVEREAVLKEGESLQIQEYTVTHEGLRQDQTRNMALLEATLSVHEDGERIGTLLPQRRLYRKFDDPFAEAAVVTGLGDEIYATLLAATEQGDISVKVSIHPLINWIWLGGTMMCLFPILGLRRLRGR